MNINKNNSNYYKDQAYFPIVKDVILRICEYANILSDNDIYAREKIKKVSDKLCIAIYRFAVNDKKYKSQDEAEKDLYQTFLSIKNTETPCPNIIDMLYEYPKLQFLLFVVQQFNLLLTDENKLFYYYSIRCIYPSIQYALDNSELIPNYKKIFDLFIGKAENNDAKIKFLNN